MSNHSSNSDPEMQEKLNKMFSDVLKKHAPNLEAAVKQVDAAEALGATGQFPQGKMTEKDEGELRMAIAVVDDKVVLTFGKPVAWVGMGPDEAQRVGEAFLAKAAEARKAGG